MQVNAALILVAGIVIYFLIYHLRIKRVDGEVPEEIEDYIKSASAQPAMSESATFNSMIELIMAGNYDYYIFDMMPHGRAIRFLSMASLLDTWINKVVDIRKETKDVDERVKRISGRTTKRMKECLRNSMTSRTGLASWQRS